METGHSARQFPLREGGTRAGSRSSRGGAGGSRPVLSDSPALSAYARPGAEKIGWTTARPSPDTKAAPSAVPAGDSSPPHPERPRRRPRRFNPHSGQTQTRGSSESRGGDTRPGCPARLARPSPHQLGPTHPPPFPAPPPTAAGARDPSTYWRERPGMFAELPPELAPFPPAAGPALSVPPTAAPAARRAAPPPEPEVSGAPGAAGHPSRRQAERLAAAPWLPRLVKGSHWPGGRRVSQPAPSRG